LRLAPFGTGGLIDRVLYFLLKNTSFIPLELPWRTSRSDYKDTRVLPTLDPIKFVEILSVAYAVGIWLHLF
ncbi:unnamed protein product, partial [Ceratitis capitata]